MHRSSGERDLVRRIHARLGSCSLIAFHHAHIAALLPVVPCARCYPAGTSAGEEVTLLEWAEQSGSSCHQQSGHDRS